MGKYIFMIMSNGKLAYVVESSEDEALDRIFGTKSRIQHSAYAKSKERSEANIMLIAEATDNGYEHMDYGIIRSDIE